MVNPDPELQTVFHQTVRSLDANRSSLQPPHHLAYKNNFNVIDLHDRLWYQIFWRFHVKSYKTKFLFSFFRTGLINAYTAINELERENLLPFRNRVLQGLLDYC